MIKTVMMTGLAMVMKIKSLNLVVVMGELGDKRESRLLAPGQHPFNLQSITLDLRARRSRAIE